MNPNKTMNKPESQEEMRELDSIQRDIWARINDELQKDGVKYDVGTAYGSGSSIKEILHPRVRKLISQARADERRQVVEEVRVGRTESMCCYAGVSKVDGRYACSKCEKLCTSQRVSLGKLLDQLQPKQ